MSTLISERPLPLAELGAAMYELVAELYPICRSITGDGVRQTLAVIQRHTPLIIHEVPTGTRVFDWTVPNEWNIRDAFVARTTGERVIDFRSCNLHVVNYSAPVKKRVSRDELLAHVHTLPEHPEWIPYRTSYYEETWGFCVSHKDLIKLTDDEYDVCIDASLEPGALTYGEAYLRGATSDEVLLTCHVCHPSLANDNLSGIALLTFLARHLATRVRHYSYRLLFIPGTIGAITWLARNERRVSDIKHGLVVAGVGNGAPPTYKRSRRGNADIDRAVAHALKHAGGDYNILDFFPYGYDERQFCSPGFDLPVGCLMRTPYSRYPEYHTSGDNLEFVQSGSLAGSLALCMSVVDVLEHNRRYRSLNPKCEPQLGRRGLYRTLGGQRNAGVDELAVLWVLNLSDGTHTLLDIAERSQLTFQAIRDAAEALLAAKLLEACPA
jgi:aminopeptidase-like protein